MMPTMGFDLYITSYLICYITYVITAKSNDSQKGSNTFVKLFIG